MAIKIDFEDFQRYVERRAESDSEIRTLLDELCASSSLIMRKPQKIRSYDANVEPEYGRIIEMFVILFLYHVASDIWAYGRTLMNLSLAEKHGKLIKSLIKQGIDKETAAALVSANMKVLTQRGEKDEALSKLISLNLKDFGNDEYKLAKYLCGIDDKDK